MNEKKACIRCQFYDDGWCRALPPVPLATGQVSRHDEPIFESCWPVVDPDDWCGKFEACKKEPA